MGWAKYAEDNNEIMMERMSYRYSNYRDTRVVSTNAPQTKSFITETIKNSSTRNTIKPVIIKHRYSDKRIRCKNCGREFVYSAHFQRIVAEKGWDDPKRCKNCRMLNKRVFFTSNVEKEGVPA